MKKLFLLVFSIFSLSAIADCPGMFVNFNMNPATCFGDCNGHGYVVVSGGSGNYSYSFVSSTYSVLPNQVNDSVYNLCAGSYYVIVNDITNGCLDTNAFTITSPPSMFAMTNGSITICQGGTGSLVSTVSGGTPGYIYSWSPAFGLSSPTVPNPMAFPPVTTTYTLTIYDANGCTVTANATVIVNPAPTVTVNSPTVCFGSPAVLTASGATVYSWNTGATSNPYTVIPSSTTTYTVTGSSGSCSATAVATVTVNSSPVVSLSPSPSTCGACNGSITTSASGAITYTWTGPSGFTSTVMNPTNLCVGTYTLTATGPSGCSTTATTTVGNSASVVATVGSVTPSGCGVCNGTATAFATGGTGPYVYSWNSVPAQTTQTATGLCPGTYAVTVFDASGCNYTAYATISSASPVTSTTSSSATACGACNGTADVTPSGGTGPYTYDWTPGNPAGDGSANIVNLCAGSYTVLVTDANGCTSTSTATVTTTNPVFVTGSGGSSTCGACNGTVFLAAGGGTPPYLYDLSNGAPQQTNGNFSGVCPGTWLGTVTDANGCAGTFTLFVTTSNTSSFTVTNVNQNETGAGLNNGSINLTVSGSAGPFTFSWSNGATTEDIYSLGAGMYTVTVTDTNGDCGMYYYNISTMTGYGYITGYAYNDNNANCVFDAGDSPLANYSVSATNGVSTYWGYTNMAGYYSIWVPTGGFVVTPYNSANLEAACTNTHNVNVTAGSTLSNNNFSYIIPPAYDVCVYTWSNGIVPGFNGFYNVYLTNYGNQSANGVVYIVLPGLVDYVSASPAATSVSGDTVFWSYSGLVPNNSMYFSVMFNTPASAPLGATTMAYVNASVTNGTDINPGCNSQTYTRIITGSFDPNDKTVSPSGAGASGDISLTEDEFSYLIRFQNTGTGPAVNITVTDTLSSMLDPMSLQVLNTSHSYVIEMLPGNVIRWHFNNIMLPDSTTDEAGSHGHIQFRINKLNAPVAGQVVENKAYIYFDFNAPVITNTAINTYQLAAGVEEVSDNGAVLVYPNPFTSETTFMIRSEKLNETYTFELKDVLGKTVNRVRTNEKQFTVNRNGLRNGMYFYTITNSDGTVGMGKVIIK